MHYTAHLPVSRQKSVNFEPAGYSLTKFSAGMRRHSLLKTGLQKTPWRPLKKERKGGQRGGSLFLNEKVAAPLAWG
jgi:hypothetical protein